MEPRDERIKFETIEESELLSCPVPFFDIEIEFEKIWKKERVDLGICVFIS